jgi:hypothetical protein
MAAYQEMCEFLGVPAFGSQLAFPDEIVLRVRDSPAFVLLVQKFDSMNCISHQLFDSSLCCNLFDFFYALSC